MGIASMFHQTSMPTCIDEHFVREKKQHTFMKFQKNKNKTNHPISRNSHPSATANKAIYSLKGAGVYEINGNII